MFLQFHHITVIEGKSPVTAKFWMFWFFFDRDKISASNSLPHQSYLIFWLGNQRQSFFSFRFSSSPQHLLAVSCGRYCPQGWGHMIVTDKFFSMMKACAKPSGLAARIREKFLAQSHLQEALQNEEGLMDEEPWSQPTYKEDSRSHIRSRTCHRIQASSWAPAKNSTFHNGRPFYVAGYPCLSYLYKSHLACYGTKNEPRLKQPSCHGRAMNS